MFGIKFLLLRSIKAGISLVLVFVIGTSLVGCKKNTLLSIGTTIGDEVSSRDNLKRYKLGVPEWANEFTVEVPVEYGDVYFSVNFDEEVAKPFDEAIVECVGKSFSSDGVSTSCVISDPSPGVWHIAINGLDPENKFKVKVTGDVDLSWRYEEMGNSGGIIKDKVTGLEWRRCNAGESWNGASLTCEGDAIWVWGYEAVSYSDAGGFHVPNVEELRSLIYCGTGDPGYFLKQGETCKSYSSYSLAEEFFPFTEGGKGWDYWTSSSNLNPRITCVGSDKSNCVKTVFLGSGQISALNRNWGAYQRRIRLVRSSTE